MKYAPFIFLFLCGTMFGYPNHSRELSSPMYKITAFKESRDLLERVEKEGAVQILTAKLGRRASYAMWYPSTRTIYLNVSVPRSEGTLIRSIVFELHNALSNKEFTHYDSLAYQRQISKQDYIRTIEEIEYENARKTAALTARAVAKGFFPFEARWNLPSTFARHLEVQWNSGHAWGVASAYDYLANESRLARRY